MPRNRHTVEQMMTTLRKADGALRKDQPVVDVCRTLGMIERTYSRWRNEYGSRKIAQAKPAQGTWSVSIRV